MLAGSAFAHAEVSPPVVVAKKGQVFTLAVPTEEENAATTKIELTPPAGFAIDSFAPVPGWKREVQSTGSGEETAIQKVTWSGGNAPHEEASMFQFLGIHGCREDVFLQGAADVLRRNGGRLVGSGVLGHAGSVDPGEVVARRWRREQHARDRRARPRGARAGRSGRGSRRWVGEARAGVTRGARLALVVVAVAGALALPAAAWAHAVLVRTTPVPSSVVNRTPPVVLLTYSEAVEPRFAIVSVTNAAGQQQIAGRPAAIRNGPTTLVVPLHRLSQGWYLVYWRVVSVDGHPVRGAFTFAVGPNPGRHLSFRFPRSRRPPRLRAWWRHAQSCFCRSWPRSASSSCESRPRVRSCGACRRHVFARVSIAFGIAAVIGLIATPVYVEMATAQFALRSAFDLGNVLPLVRDSAFGRGFLDLELTFGLFVLAAALALWVDRPERPQRSIAELLAGAGALLAAGATLLVPGLSGHAAQTSPRGLTLALDWLHLVAGSVWIGGLIGLLVLWWSLPAARRVAGLMVCVPRFSNTAFVSVLVLIGSGIGASLIHLPTLSSLWQTSYGQTLLVKIGLLCAALADGAGQPAADEAPARCVT